MTLPSARALCDVIDITWPAAAKSEVAGFIIRNGQGGGQRVSAATAIGASGAIGDADVSAAEDAMDALGQPPLFMVRPDDTALDATLARRGYDVKDTTLLYATPIGEIAAVKPPPVTSFQVWPPLVAQLDIWAEGGTSPARIAVMERATCPKTSFLGRVNDRPAASAFAGIAHDCAMLHALHVAPPDRRNGLAANLTRAAAIWGQSLGATWFTLPAVKANNGANALYTSLGMQVVGQYHYRIKRND